MLDSISRTSFRQTMQQFAFDLHNGGRIRLAIRQKFERRSGSVCWRTKIARMASQGIVCTVKFARSQRRLVGSTSANTDLFVARLFRSQFIRTRISRLPKIFLLVISFGCLIRYNCHFPFNLIYLSPNLIYLSIFVTFGVTFCEILYMNSRVISINIVRNCAI